MQKQPAERKPRDNSIFAVMNSAGEITSLVEAGSIAHVRKHLLRDTTITKASALTVARSKLTVERAGD